ncbi:NnrU family protein in cluster with Mesaconyl-CoA hydratase [Rhodovulum sp. P5]|uniref:NnrU family protein n=1 Tax=Rhodovulum sp. P5 TaxID=1564506 RepID=UPI0009C27A11|nr:NnrU family protein [Rhodovulum sp. P5]ARE38762.1 NnrU family protein in cluster with Mesaconyl-CoA hydratase [Rhodovulum sp. P5]
MFYLLLGVLLWSFAHLFKRVFPDLRKMLDDTLGNWSKIVFAVPLVASVVLMVMGYRGNTAPILYQSPDWMVHINNTLMLLAVTFFGVGNSKSHARQWFRHPQLYGFISWAVAHLLVNGDLASILLFGGLLIWAIAEIVLINRQETGVTRYSGGSLKGDLRLLGISIVVYLVIIGLHIWAGVWPLPVTGT